MSFILNRHTESGIADVVVEPREEPRDPNNISKLNIISALNLMLLWRLHSNGQMNGTLWAYMPSG
jgi:hypothetical protein